MKSNISSRLVRAGIDEWNCKFISYEGGVNTIPLFQSFMEIWLIMSQPLQAGLVYNALSAL